MRQSHSHSKRDLLETCPRRYFYEYYASSLKEQSGSPGVCVQRSLFDDDPAERTTRFPSDRIPMARQLKRLSGCFLLAGDILHQLIALHLKKRSDWPVQWFLDKACERYDEAVIYSRDPMADASLANQRYPPPILMEFFYDDPRADERSGEARQKLLGAIQNFFQTTSVVELSQKLLEGDPRIEVRVALDKLDGFGLEGRVDLAGRDAQGVQVVDWKMGRMTGSHDSLQLVTYGWWAAKEYEVDPTCVRVRRVFLADPTIEEDRPLSESLLRRGKARIIQDVELMKQMDTYGRAGNEEAFPPCEIENVCRQCKYQALCPANRSGLTSKRISGSSAAVQRA